MSVGPYASLNLAGHVGDDADAVSENRERAAGALGLDPRRVVWLAQVHGADVVTATAPYADPPPADAAVTARPGLALAVLVADCVPVLLADPRARVVAAAHAGRRGVAGGVVPAAITAMAALGADPARIVAHLGPAICGGCYAVSEALREEVDAIVPGTAATSRDGRPALDLRAGAARQLTDAGVATVSVEASCTAEDASYYSFRRDGTTGRFAGYVWLAS